MGGIDRDDIPGVTWTIVPTKAIGVLDNSSVACSFPKTIAADASLVKNSAMRTALRGEYLYFTLAING